MIGRACRRAWAAAGVGVVGAGVVAAGVISLMGGCERGTAGGATDPATAVRASGSISGRVTTADGAGVPSSAVVEVRLEELPGAEASPGAGVEKEARAAAPTTPLVVGVRRIQNPGAVPAFFVLVYDPTKISLAKTYGVSASIIDRGRVRWTSPRPTPVETGVLRAGGKVVLPSDVVVGAGS